jgi:hypothetical protein
MNVPRSRILITAGAALALAAAVYAPTAAADDTVVCEPGQIVVDGNCNLPAAPQDDFAPPASDFFAPAAEAPMGGDSVDIGGGGVDVATGGVDVGGGGVDVGGAH